MKFFSSKSLVFLLSALILLLPTIGKANFGIHLGTHIGVGRLGNDTAQVQNRSMGSFDLQAIPGYQFFGSSLLLGLLLEYRLLSQLTAEGDVSGENFSGGGFSLGPSIVYRVSLVKLAIGYDLMSKQSTHTPNGKLSGSAFRFLIGYELFPSLYTDLTLNIHSYGNQEINDRDVNLINKAKHWNFGFGLSFSY